MKMTAPSGLAPCLPAVRYPSYQRLIKRGGFKRTCLGLSLPTSPITLRDATGAVGDILA